MSLASRNGHEFSNSLKDYTSQSGLIRNGQLTREISTDFYEAIRLIDSDIKPIDDFQFIEKIYSTNDIELDCVDDFYRVVRWNLEFFPDKKLPVFRKLSEECFDDEYFFDKLFQLCFKDLINKIEDMNEQLKQKMESVVKEDDFDKIDEIVQDINDLSEDDQVHIEMIAFVEDFDSFCDFCAKHMTVRIVMTISVFFRFSMDKERD